MEISYKKLKNLSGPLDNLIHDTDTDYDWNALKESIEQYGIKDPLVLEKFTNGVKDGNHRLAIAKLIYPPDKEIACVYEDKEFWESYKDRLKSKYRLTIP